MMLQAAHLSETLSVSMKVISSIIIICLFITFGFFQLDVASDKRNQVKVITTATAYNDWQCGYEKTPNCRVLFTLAKDSLHSVQRIRYGKDFMAIKVFFNGFYDWVISGKEVELIAN
jgi:hypothetical protein